MRCNNGKLLLILLTLYSFMSQSEASLILSKTEPVNDEYYYTIKMWIGTPSREYNLRVCTSVSDIILLSNITLRSSSYSDTKQTDIVTLQRGVFRVPVKLLPRSDESGYTEETKMDCDESKCQGFIGLNQSSFIWKLGRWVSFGNGFIVVGSEPYLPKSSLNLPRRIAIESRCISCNYSITSDSNGYVDDCKGIDATSSEQYKAYHPVSLTITDTLSILPFGIYESYFGDKNVYSDNTNSWKPLKIVASSSNCRDEKYGPKIPSISSSLGISLAASELIDNENFYSQTLLVEKSNHDDEFYLLSYPTLLNNYVLSVSHSSDSLMLIYRPFYNHIYWLDLFLTALVSTLFINWEIGRLSINGFYTTISQETGFMTFQTLSIYAILPYALFNERTSNILQYEDPDRFFFLVVSSILCATLDCGMILFSFFKQRDTTNTASMEHTDTTKTKSLASHCLRNVCITYASLNSVWCFLLQRRTFQSNSVPCLVANLYLTYVLMYELGYFIIGVIRIKKWNKKATIRDIHPRHVSSVGYVATSLLAVTLSYSIYYTFFVAVIEWCYSSSEMFYYELSTYFSVMLLIMTCYVSLNLSSMKVMKQINFKNE